MHGLDPLGLGGRLLRRPQHLGDTEYVLARRPLGRILAFTRRSIDDVVNDPVAKNEVYGYFKLSRQVERAGEVRDLERQWNGVA